MKKVKRLKLRKEIIELFSYCVVVMYILLFFSALIGE